MARSENLTIMFTDMVGFTETTSSQSREENENMLRKHDQIMSPIIRQFSGKKVKTIGDAYLVTFRSSTDAVQCGMAMHDAIAAYNIEHPDEKQLQIRVAIHVGEVRTEDNDIFGEAVNIAARVESLTPPDEVYFSHSVYLAMNKAEIPSEVVGTYKLKGIPERVKIHRVPRHRVTRLRAEPETVAEEESGELPFGGMHTTRKASVALPEIPYKWIGAGVAAVLLIFVAVKLMPNLMDEDFQREAEPLIIAKEWQKLDELVKARLSENQENADAILVRGHSKYARQNITGAFDDYKSAVELEQDLRSDSRLIANIVDSANSKGTQEFIKSFGGEELAAALASRAEKEGYWGRAKAIQGLRTMGKTDMANPVQVAILDLKEGPDCDQRLDAVRRLRKLKDPAALPVLKDAIGDIKDKVKNLCLWADAKAAIKELGG